ncbi:MAG: cation:proton antiporter [Alphaproteobacteria bacterium]|nr:cation:proton antiporter [Alphaproteobacteria bacterium]
MHQHSEVLQDIVVFLAVAGIVVPVMKRLAISPILGFIVIGMLIGPHGLAQFAQSQPWLAYVTISDGRGIATFAELGVVFLLFMIGLELSFERLNSMGGLVFGLGGAQVVISAVVIGLIAYSFGNSAEASVLMGACLALSSTAVVMQLLIEKKRLATPVGRASFSILLFQDLAVVPILFLTTLFGTGNGDGGILLGLATALAEAALVIALIVLIGRIIIRPLFHSVGAAKSRELFMAVVLLAIIGTATLTERAGLSLALGAFLAGLLLAETEYRHQIEVDVEPFKGLLLGLFFLAIGMSLDPVSVSDNLLWVAASVIGLYALKAAIIYALARLAGLPSEVAAEASLLLGQGGEFAFVVLTLALSLGVVEEPVVQFMLVVTTLSMLATPPMARAARLLGAYLTPAVAEGSTDALKPPDNPPGILKNHVIIAGYGRVGQLLGNLLDNQCIPHVAIDLDVETVSHSRIEDRAVYFGDASDPHILEKLNVEEAAALVVTMDNHEATEDIVAAASKRWPGTAIVARARDRRHALRLLEKGATSVVPETVEASLDLAEVVFAETGIGIETARQIIADRRQIERAALTGR